MTDRQIVYPGALPADTDILGLQRNLMIAAGYLARATLGTGTVVDGLAISQTTVPSMTVIVGPGAITSLSTVDATAFGSLTSDSNPLVKIGITEGTTQFTLTAPTTSGQSINYLIEATLAETDATPVVLPYYNASNPSSPYLGPSNSGVAQNTQRLQRCSLQLKPGVAAAAGTQTTPAVDSGWVGLYVITVNYGQTAITNANLAGATLAGAPFIAGKLGNVLTGASPTTDSSSALTTSAWVQALLSGLTSSWLASSGFAYSSGATGFLKLPASLGGFIINWWTGTADPADSTEPTQSAVWALAFPNVCFGALVSMNIASATNLSDNWYQLVGSASGWAAGVTVQRQRPGASGDSFTVATTPFVVAIGR